LGQAVAASCAIPGYFTPVDIGGTEYFDGGVHSPTSADVLRREHLDLVVVVSPMSGHGRDASLGGALRSVAHRRLAREAARLRASGTRVLSFEPTPEARAAMGPNPMAEDRSVEVVDVATAEVVARLRDPRIGDRLAMLAADRIAPVGDVA
jgi:NTE family protein